jgi:ribonuclease I
MMPSARLGKESIKAVKLTCNGNPAYLTEMQLSLNADTINAPLSAASLPRSHIPVTAANSSLSIKSVTDLPRADAMHQIPCVHRALNGIME